ncbi:MAG TPA: hypothetical protein V6D17_05745, partial [Candidatus Obscuribacterales bacterium]
MNWENTAASRHLNREAEQIASMLDTGDPYYTRDAAQILREELSRLPGQMALSLLGKTQLYEQPGIGADLVVRPAFTFDRNGVPYDSGYLDFRVEGPGVSESVARVAKDPHYNYGYELPRNFNRFDRFDRFDPVSGIMSLFLGAMLNGRRNEGRHHHHHPHLTYDRSYPGYWQNQWR